MLSLVVFSFISVSMRIRARLNSMEHSIRSTNYGLTGFIRVQQLGASFIEVLGFELVFAVQHTVLGSGTFAVNVHCESQTYDALHEMRIHLCKQGRVAFWLVLEEPHLH
jgi:hypothetical protein